MELILVPLTIISVILLVGFLIEASGRKDLTWKEELAVIIGVIIVAFILFR